MTEDEKEPPYLYPDYVGTRLRAPAKPLVALPDGFHDFPAPLFPLSIAALDNDLTRQHPGEPIGERIIVTGRVLDSDGRPLRNSVVEIWQANASGRYLDQETRMTSTRRRSTRTSAARAGASPMPTAATGSSPSSRGHIRGRTIATPGARRTSTSRSSGASTAAGWSPRCIFQATR